MGQPDDDCRDIRNVMVQEFLYELRGARQAVQHLQDTMVRLQNQPIHLQSDHDMGRMYTLLQLGAEFTVAHKEVWWVVRLKRVGRNIL